MRFGKELRFLFLLSLTLGLFCGELGESFRLADDASNDLVQVSTASIHKCAEIASRDLISQRSITVPQELIVNFAVVTSTDAAPSSGPDLLRLLSIQRK